MTIEEIVRRIVREEIAAQQALASAPAHTHVPCRDWPRAPGKGQEERHCPGCARRFSRPVGTTLRYCQTCTFKAATMSGGYDERFGK